MSELQHLQKLEIKIFGQPLAKIVMALSFRKRLERAWGVIETQYRDPRLNLASAAKASGISKNHLNVFLRRKTSFTFYQLLTRYRLLKAIAMMEEKNYNLLEIAEENGFNSFRAFERNFFKVLGTVPREMRKKMGDNHVKFSL